MRHWREATDRKTLAEAVDRLKRSVEAAIYTRDDFTADLAHQDLIAAEWRLRQAERRP